MTNKTPIWLLDVDGVLNALPWRGATDWTGLPSKSWDDYLVGHASPDPADADRGPKGGYTITYSPELMRRIRELHESGAVEVRWLTTWGRGANLELRELLDLPEFVVAGEPDVLSGFAGAPAHRWWKFDDARRVREAEPDRPIIWTDDDLVHVSEACEWAKAEGVFAISTDDTRGITPVDFDNIVAFIERKASEDAAA